VIEAHEHKGDFKSDEFTLSVAAVREGVATMRLFNAYSLFGAGNRLQDAIEF
jgi:hypothetical protein